MNGRRDGDSVPRRTSASGGREDVRVHGGKGRTKRHVCASADLRYATVLTHQRWKLTVTTMSHGAVRLDMGMECGV